VGYSHPEWLVARWQKRWGAEETGELMDWNNAAPKTFARVNTLKSEPGKLLAQWREEDVDYDFVRHNWLEENLVFELKSHPPLERLPSFQQGLFYVQDPSTLLAVSQLDPQPGETVLDYCAAPGGKLTYIAQLMRNEGRLVAYDVSPERMRLVEENCARLGINCVEILEQAHLAINPDGRARLSSTRRDNERRTSGRRAEDRRALPRSASSIHRFDRVLVDAPCSNTGVMRRRVGLRWRIRAEEIQRLRAIQLDLLRKAAEYLKPGGVMVYSTCSLEPEENQRVVEGFLQEKRDFKLEKERELLPFRDGVDGVYVARLRRVN
jgi:16S rRNA (cytosine967-C5)-methyltransferase